LEDRKRFAKRKVWGEQDFIPESYKNINVSITEYKGLIYDSEREFRDTLLSKLRSLENQLVEELDSNKITVILRSQETIQKRIDELDLRIDVKEEKIKLKAGKKLSYIETFIRNRTKYEEKMAEVMKLRAKEDAEDD
jgi:hypothetical protein